MSRTGIYCLSPNFLYVYVYVDDVTHRSSKVIRHHLQRQRRLPLS